MIQAEPVGCYIYFSNRPGVDEPLMKGFLMQDFLIESMAGWVKDAHKVRISTIYYSYHPLHGESVKIIRSVGDNYIIEIQNGKRIGIPKWMTDKTKCLQVKHSSIPYCSYGALRELQSLLACCKDYA